MLFEEVAAAATEAEKVCAVTDLINGFILIPIFLLVLKIKTDRPVLKKYWLSFLAFLAGCDLLGFVAHYFCTEPPLLFHIVWVPLYFIMLVAPLLLLFISLYLRSHGKHPTRKFALYSFLCTLPVLCALSIPGFFSVNMIIPYAAIATLIVLPALFLLFRPAFAEKNKGALLLLCSLVPLIPCVIFQFCRSASFTLVFEFNCDSISHLFILTTEILLFFSARVCLLKKER